MGVIDMGGRGATSATSQSGAGRGVGSVGGFQIDTNADFQKIATGMAPRDAIDAAAGQIASLPYEMAVLVTEDGTMYVSKGSEGRVRPPYRELAADGYDASKVFDLHNHPAEGKRPIGGPSSDADWNVMFAKGQTESYIVAKEGRYTIRVTDPSKLDKAKAFFSTNGKNPWQRKQSNYDKNVRKQYESGMFDRYRERGGSLIAAQHTLQKFGKKYGFESVFEPNPGYEHLYD